jgi:hypothetical protein
MSIGDALSKIWTYGKIDEQSRVRTGTMSDTLLRSALAYDVVSMGIQKIAKRLNGAATPWYLTTASTLTISGSANPYSVDLSSVSPYIDQLIRVVHVTSGGTRTIVRQLQPEEAENYSSMTNAYAGEIGYVHEGDSLRLYKLTSFTITTASDTIEIKYYRQPKIGTATSTSVVYDGAFTSSGITISAFTGMTQALVGGTFVGNDTGSHTFARAITKYISTTSFEISSALTDDGATGVGFIIPPSSNTAAVTSGTYIDLPDSHAMLLLDEVASRYLRLKGTPDPALENSVDNQLNEIHAIGLNEKAQTKAEK